MTVSDYAIFIRDVPHIRSWAVRAEDGKGLTENLAVVLRLADSDRDHLVFDCEAERDRFYALLGSVPPP